MTATPPSRAARLAEAAAVGGYLLLMAALYARCSDAKLLWFDELFTMHLARAPLDLWANLRAGVDLQPPLSYLLTGLSVGLLGETEFALRLPAWLGGLTALATTYLTARRRGRFEAFAAMTLVGAVTPVGVYFFEARPYGVTLGLVGIAVYCRQERWRWGVAVAVALGMATHYYFAVAVVALGVAEAVRIAETHRADWGMAAALGVSLVVLAALAPLWTEGPREYKAGFWGKRPLGRGAVEAAYSRFSDGSLTPSLALAFAVAAVVRRGATPPPAADSDGDGPTPVSDAAAFAALALAPVLGVAIASKVVGGGDGRYTLYAVLGLAPILARALGALANGHPAALAAASAVFAATAALEFGNRMPAHHRAERAELGRLAASIDAATPPGGAALVGSCHDAARLWHYRLPRAPFYFLADPAEALRHGGTDTNERAFAALGRLADTPTLDAAELRRRVAAGEIRLYVGPPVPAARPWLGPHPLPQFGGAPPWYAVTAPPPEATP